MDNANSFVFELTEHVIQYDFSTDIMLCRRISDNRNIWIRKVPDGGHLINAIEDDKMFYLAFESDEKSGIFLAVDRADGSTRWEIPGKSYLSQIFGEYLFLIFIDSKDDFYLIKVRRDDGSKIWHHPVLEDLYEYIIKRDSISLRYLDGRTEDVSLETGMPSK